MNYTNYLKSEHWKDTKLFLKHFGGGCYVCGSQSGLHVHHLIYTTIGYEDGDELVYLCPRHHLELHFFGGDKNKKRPIDTPDDLRRACNKLISMRSKHQRPMPNDPVVKMANYIREKYCLKT